MPDFVGSKYLTLLSEARNVPVSLTFDACSSATDNDGAIPYGDTIASAVVKAYSPAGTEVTSSMVTQAASVDGSTVSCEISYYTGCSAGTYTLRTILTLASGAILSYRLARVKVA